MGIPCFGEFKERYGCPIDFEHLLKTKKVSHSAVRSMAGNGWQLMPVGLLYMHVLSKLEFVTDSMFCLVNPLRPPVLADLPVWNVPLRNKKLGDVEDLADSDNQDDGDDASSVYSFPQHWTDEMPLVGEDELELSLKLSLYMDGTVEVSDDSQPSEDLTSATFEGLDTQHESQSVCLDQEYAQSFESCFEMAELGAEAPPSSLFGFEGKVFNLKNEESSNACTKCFAL